jgi:NTE family protein
MSTIEPASKRALVLGGGGTVGIAWEIGLLAGLRQAGIDVGAVDVIVGTSAGSVVGSRIAHGTDPRDLLASLRNDAPQPAGGEAPVRDTQAAAEAFGLWGSADRMTPERCAAVGAVALRASTISESDYLARFEAQTPAAWPATPLLITAVDCESGELHVFDAASGVPLPRAISASCSVPTLFPPVTIAGRRYTDGGVRSGTSADLALPFAPGTALIIAPLGSADRGIHNICRRQAIEEAQQLEAAGARVTIVHMDEASLAAGGGNLMDVAARIPTADAAYAQGQRLAAVLDPAWSHHSARANATTSR